MLINPRAVAHLFGACPCHPGAYRPCADSVAARLKAPPSQSATDALGRVKAVLSSRRIQDPFAPVATKRSVHLKSSLDHAASVPFRRFGTQQAAEQRMEYALEFSPSTLRFGDGVTQEVGMDMRDFGCSRVLVLTDKNLVQQQTFQVVLESLSRAGVEAVVFDDVAIEPTAASFQAAAAAATAAKVDGFVAFGGGSVMDTAKAANLYSTYPPADFFDYVNAPIGKGLVVPGPLQPLIAIPTTCGTGSEATGIAIFDTVLPNTDGATAKTGIGSRLIKPTLGLVDPRNVVELPRGVVLASGLDVLNHALESYTAIPYTQRGPAPARPALRPAYQGSNPMSDVWALHSLRLLAENYLPALSGNADAKGRLLNAASYAGVGFGSAGVHLCHGMSYAISSRAKVDTVVTTSDGETRPFTPAAAGLDGYPEGKVLVPHGVAVALTGPAVFRWTAPSDVDRHVTAARILGTVCGPDGEPGVLPRRIANETTAGGRSADRAAGELSEVLGSLLERIGCPNGLSALGYSASSVEALVEGTLPQQRVLALSPRKVNADAIADMLRDSFKIW